MTVIENVGWKSLFYSAAVNEVADFLKDNTATCYIIWKNVGKKYYSGMSANGLGFINSEGYDHTKTVADFFLFLEEEMRKMSR